MGNSIKFYGVPVYVYDVINKEYHKVPKEVKDNESLQIFIKGHYKIPYGEPDFIKSTNFGHTLYFKIVQNDAINNDNQENINSLKNNILWILDNTNVVCTCGAPTNFIKEGIVVIVFKKDYKQVFNIIKQYYPDLYYKRIPIYIVSI
jgi:hypothetical protein